MSSYSRTMTFTAPDNDLQKFVTKCAEYGISPEKALSGFVGDLISGENTGGSDERMMADQYFNRRYSADATSKTFLRWAIQDGCIDDVMNAINDIDIEVGEMATNALADDTECYPNQADLEELAKPFQENYQRYVMECESAQVKPESVHNALNSVERYQDDLYGRRQAQTLYHAICDALREEVWPDDDEGSED